VSEQHDAFHERGRRALLAHEEIWEVPPHPGSPRWGISLVLRPVDAAAARLARVASQLAHVAGPRHWPTGRLGSAHLTVRVLEPYRNPVPLDDPVVIRYAEAARRIGDQSRSPRFAMTGLLVALGGVLVAAEPRNQPAAELRALVAAELGEDGHYENDTYRGDLWWSTLLHFTEPLVDGAALVAWVEDRRALDLGPFQAGSLDLVRYEYDGGLTAPVALASIPLSDQSVPSDQTAG
jgi:hypothetical protein